MMDADMHVTIRTIAFLVFVGFMAWRASKDNRDD